MNRPAMAALAMVLLAVLAVHGCTRRLPHAEVGGLWPFKGGHRGVACEACHGPRDAPNQGCSGWPKKQSTSCRDCHLDVLPDPGHYPNEECFPCHDEDGWEIDEGATGDTGAPAATGETADTGFVHEPVGEAELCWTCHEDERPTAPEHWINVPLQDNAWDCGPCHTLESWVDDATFVPEHAVRVPHGTADNFSGTPPQDWVVACTPCHVVGAPYTEFQCTDSCHLTDVFDNPADPEHNDMFPWEDPSGCLDCHWYGDYLRPQ